MAFSTAQLQDFPSKPRVFILSDISNEPDDAESLVRYLLYSNQFTTEGLVACTSTWMGDKVCPQDMRKIIDAYRGVVDNLNAHAHPDSPYPSADYMMSLIKSGPPVYGMAAVGPDVPLSEGGELLLSRITAASEEPLWILCWGGTNVLAQVLLKIQSTYSPSEAEALRSKLRVYAISDQDDTGPWIRQQFPDLFYIASIHGWNQYRLATWTGISGESYYHFDQPSGPDPSQVTKEWLKTHIQVGPLGSAYPDPMFIPEGDTPTFLYMIQNGLGCPENPSYGSWGGRYVLSSGGLTAVSKKQRKEGPPTTGGSYNSRHYGDAYDTVPGCVDKTQQYTSNQATIWRWRRAFQSDFAARMQWTLTPDLTRANHHPVIRLSATASPSSSPISLSSFSCDAATSQFPAPINVTAQAGSTFVVDASETYHPNSPDSKGDDNTNLTFTWFQYKEPTASQHWVEAEVSNMEILSSVVNEKKDGASDRSSGSKVEIRVPPADKSCVDLFSRESVQEGQVLHLVLEVTAKGDNEDTALTSYQRILVKVVDREEKETQKHTGFGQFQ